MKGRGRRGRGGGPLKLAPGYGLHPISLKLHSLQMWRLAYRQTMLCSIATIKINPPAKEKKKTRGEKRGEEGRHGTSKTD